MTGFIRGLFGGKKEAAPPQPPTPQDKSAYYLEPDDAKSYGNIEYMRSSKTVKRTFARKKGVAEELKSIKQISAMEVQRLREDGTLDVALNNQSNGASAPKEQPSNSRRQSDSSMDMFRNMARDMKK
ncbi:MAG TPA: hypothetical protein V6D06_02190 [Trichocoleus sp.]